MSSTLAFQVGELLNSKIGDSENYSFEGSVEFDFVDSKSPIVGKLKLMKTDKGIYAEASDVEITVSLQCDRCLKAFPKEIKLSSTSRQYLLDTPEHIEDPNDIFVIDRQKNEIDIADMLRQEIILHFPQVPVCYEGCKGICAHCGVNRSEKNCKCADEQEPENKPLSALKDLIK
jgi:uncharacterized protein